MNLKTFTSIATNSVDPLRTLLRLMIKSLAVGSYEWRVRIGAVERPHYGHIVYQAARLAKQLGHERISVIELGVAGGHGLLNLEYHAAEVEKIFGVKIEVYGFDLGEGLPEPVDYRDVPYIWKKGFYKMDVPKLQSRLKRAKLIIGNVEETTKDFFTTNHPAPVGAIACDLDFYSSTADSLKMLEADQSNFLPRVFCYFDDVTAKENNLFNEFTGERLAIDEFNRAHDKIKLGTAYYLQAREIVRQWYHHIWICHFFSHNSYNDFINNDDLQLPL